MPTAIQIQNILGVFFKNTSNPEIRSPEGTFKISKNEKEGYKFFIQKKGGKKDKPANQFEEEGFKSDAEESEGEDEGKLEEIDEKEYPSAIKALGKILIFDAAKSGNTKLYKACIDAGASKDEVDGDGKKLLGYARGNFKSREIEYLISGITKDRTTGKLQKPKDKFRELAIKVREEYLKHKKEGEAVNPGIIKVVIDKFGTDNASFDLSGLTAQDMIAFMEDIVIKGKEGVYGEEKGAPNLDKIPTSSYGGRYSNLQKLLQEKSSTTEDDSGDEGRRKDFYPKLLISCLEHEHYFLSEEHSDNNIRKLIVKDVQKRIQKRILDSKEVKVGVVEGEEKSDGDLALNCLKKESVVGLYMSARFNELKKREGLKDDLTYEDFSQNLGKVVKINSDLDRQEHKSGIKKASSELQKLEEEGDELLRKIRVETTTDAKSRKSGVELSDEERKAKTKDLLKEMLTKHLTSYNKNEVLKEAYDAITAKITAKKLVLNKLKGYEASRIYGNSVDEVNRALRALLGSTDKKQSGENTDHIAHGDLRIALNMMREDIEFSDEEIKKQRGLLQSKAAINLGAALKNFSSRLNVADVKKIPSQLKLEQNVGLVLTKQQGNFDENLTVLPEENRVDKNDSFFTEYVKKAIQQVVGDKISKANTGLVIHKFFGQSGFSKFTNQVDKANRERVTGDIDRVSIAHIEEMPNGDGPKKSSFCIAVLDNKGATKIFSEKIPEISRRSEDLYKENLKFSTNQKAIELAIEALIEARNKTFQEPENFGGKLEIAQTEKNCSKYIFELKKCRADSLEDAKRKEEKDISLSNFLESEDGKIFIMALNFEETQKKQGFKNPVINPRLATIIKQLIDGSSSEDMRNEARAATLKQIQKEIAANVKSSMEDNKSIFDLNILETVQAVATYKDKRDYSDYFYAKDIKGFEKLLKEEMPASAYKGISVFRPRFNTNIATVIFNGCEGDDTIYLTLPNTPECYVRVSRCDEDKNVLVWRNGKEITENHKKGDLIIDTGVVFHKKDNGKYETIPFSKLHEFVGSDDERVKKAALDFEIKAISVNENQRLSSSTLYSGRQLHFPLEAKNLPIQKVDAHDPERKKIADVVFKKLGKETLAANLVVEIGDYAKLIINNDGLEFITDLDKYPVKKEYLKSAFKEKFKEKFQELWTGDRKEAFKTGLSKYFSNEFLGDSLTAEIFLEEYPKTLEKESKKYAVINTFEDFSLVIPVESIIDDFVPKPNFLKPEIQFEENGKMITKTLGEEGFKKKIDSLKEPNLEKFLFNFFNKEEIGDENQVKDFLKKEENYEKLCEKIKDRCKKAYVTVGYQKVESDGTRDYEPCYKDVGELEKKTFVYTENPLMHSAENINSAAKRIVIEGSSNKTFCRTAMGYSSGLPTPGKLFR